MGEDNVETVIARFFPNKKYRRKRQHSHIKCLGYDKGFTKFHSLWLCYCFCGYLLQLLTSTTCTEYFYSATSDLWLCYCRLNQP